MEDLEMAIEILRNGGIAIYPTDTAFGIGCRIDDPEAVKRLFAIKKRSENQATPILVSSVAMAKEYVTDVLPEVEKLTQKYWPGALTIIFPCKTEKVSRLVRGGSNTVGLRMPNHEIPLTLVREISVPIIGTSANFHGAKTPYIYEDLYPELISKVDIAIPGECIVKQSSTVVDCTVSPWKVLREGAIKL